MKCATTANVIEFFQNYIFNTFGVPLYIHSGNGKQFVSKYLEEFLSEYGIKHIKTGLYSPQANSAERANREIVSKLKFLLKDETHHLN